MFSVKRNEFFISQCWMCFRSVWKTIYHILFLVSYKNTHQLKGRPFKRHHFLIFFQRLEDTFHWAAAFLVLIVKFNIDNKKVTNLIFMCNFVQYLIEFKQTWGRGWGVLVFSCNHMEEVLSWLAHSDCFHLFLIFLLNFLLFVFYHRYLNQIVPFHFFYHWEEFEYQKPIWCLRGWSLQLIFFSKTLTCSASVGRAIRHLLWSLWAQPLNKLAESHLRELYLKSFWSCSDRCSNISQRLIVSWKLYICWAHLNLLTSWSDKISLHFHSLRLSLHRP